MLFAVPWVTFLSGQPDPTDESRFTIQYRVNDQPGTIEGSLANDGSVKMQVRDGSWKKGGK